MPAIVSCQSLTKSYYSKTLFENLSFGVDDGDHVGIIGPNGSGKSTLLRILAGLEDADAGQISIRRLARIAYVPQVPALDDNNTVIAPLTAAAMGAGRSQEEASTAAYIMAGKIGFEDPDRKIAGLSGGWKKRLTVACGLIQNPDLLLLDEPTNHLDLEGILWLEDLMKTASFAWMTVSHDRSFLSRAPNRMIEVSPIYSEGAFASAGGYGEFLRKRNEYLEARKKHEQSLSSKVRRESEWLARGPKARSTKARYRVEEAESMIRELRDMRSTKSGPSGSMEFSATGRKTKRLLTMEGVDLRRGKATIANGLDLVLAPGMSLGLLGRNGTGKTSLMRLMAGELTPEAGDIIRADGLRMVYFDQNRAQLDPQWSLQRALSDTGDTVIYQDRPVHVITWAKRFRFSPEHLHVKLGDLSGGEQARVLIARLMLQPADLLLLDEPTNDLDIETLELLEESLVEFPGALVLVSHDRSLLQAACNLYLGLDGRGGVKLFSSYEQWERDVLSAPFTTEATKSNKVSTPGRQGPSKSAPQKKKLSYMEQREYDAMEEAILEAEQHLERCKARANDPAIATSSAALQDAAKELENTQKVVDELYTRWAELEAKVK